MTSEKMKLTEKQKQQQNKAMDKSMEETRKDILILQNNIAVRQKKLNQKFIRRTSLLKIYDIRLNKLINLTAYMLSLI